MTMQQKNREVEELEAQLRIVSQAAAQAIERASVLENELESSRLTMSRSTSQSSLMGSDCSASSQDERLSVLENALDAIFRARTELSARHNYQYL